MENILDGTDLILSVNDGALAFSTGCKITTSAETGERMTKEASGASISADGLVCTDADSGAPTYDQLKDLMLSGTPVTASYNIREAGQRTGKTTGGYKGKYIITSLDLDGQAGDDAKYTVQLENYGKVEKQTNGLQSGASSVSEHSEQLS